MAKKTLEATITANAKGLETEVARSEAAFRKLGLAASSTGSFSDKLLDRTAGLRAGLSQIVAGDNPFEVLKQGAYGLVGAIPGVGTEIAAGLRVVESAFNKIRDTQKAIAEEGKHAKALGASVEEYSQLKFAIGDVDLLDKMLFKIGERSAEAAINGGDAALAFQALGLDAKQLAGQHTSTDLLKIAQALKEVKNDAERVKLAGDIFGGRLGVTALPELMKGEEGLRKLMQMADERGLTTTDEMVAKAKEANLAWKALDAQNESFWKSLSVNTAPLVAQIANDIERASKVKLPGTGKESFTDAVTKAFGIGGLTLWNFAANRGNPFSSAMADAIKSFGDMDDRATDAAEKQRQSANSTELAALNAKQLAKEMKDASDFADEFEKNMRAERDRAQEAFDKSSSPVERMNSELEKVNGWLLQNLLSTEQWEIMTGKIVSDFLKIDQLQQSKNTPALAFGSAAEFTARVKAEEQNVAGAGADLVRERFDQFLQQSKEQTKLLREITEGAKKVGLLNAP